MAISGQLFREGSFSGKRSTFRKCSKKGQNEFKLKWKWHENVAQGLFFDMNKLSLGFIACSVQI